MKPIRFTVTQVRVAASCPRIFYFDWEHTKRNDLKYHKTTRIWKSGAETTALGSLFHHSIEAFNKAADTSEMVHDILNMQEGATAIQQSLQSHIFQHYIKQEKLYAATGAQQQGFINALRHYVGELAAILAYGVGENMPLSEILDHLFGDTRKKVDVTFKVGQQGEGIHVVGILDYVFHDFRDKCCRIIDYKLTPPDGISNDLFQVCVYALMHNVQHQTQADAAVLYLHPKREMIEKKWSEIFAERHKIYNLLASMREWTQFDEEAGNGLKPLGEPCYCAHCPWDKKDQCIQRLGPKHEGGYCEHWKETTPDSPSKEPETVVAEPDPDTGADEEVENQPVTPAKEEIDLSAHLCIGTVNDSTVGIPVNCLNTHTAVVGAAGSGKTWLAKVLVEEAVLQGIPVIAIDPQGDLAQFLKPSARGGELAEEKERFDRYWKTVEPRVYTPGSSHAKRMHMNPMRLSRLEDLGNIENDLRRQEELDSMIEVAAGNLVALASAGGEEDAQRTAIYQMLKVLMREKDPEQIKLQTIVSGLLAPEDLGFDNMDHMIKKADREKLARKLNAILLGPGAKLFSGGVPLDLDHLRKPSNGGNTPLNVIYLNALTDDTQKHFFVASLAAEVYRWMVSSLDNKGGVNLLFYIDEARDYMPAGGTKPPAKEPLIRLFTQGRKFGVACLLCTQSPRSVDYNVFGNCSTKIIGRLEASQDVDRVAEWFQTNGPTPPWIKDRKGAEPGTFVGRWPKIPAQFEGTAFKGRFLYSLHEGAWSPDRLDEETGEIKSELQ